MKPTEMITFLEDKLRRESGLNDDQISAVFAKADIRPETMPDSIFSMRNLAINARVSRAVQEVKNAGIGSPTQDM